MVAWCAFIVYTIAMPARPRYQQVKDLVRERIAAGELAEGDALPSEEELAASLGFSRLTVHRALRELTADGVLVRFRRRGTFVAPLAPQSSAITVEPSENQDAQRGHRHGARLVELGATKADAPLAQRLEVRSGTRVFHSTLVHLEDGVPIQLEERWVNPRVVPDYLDVDFTRTTPTQHLLAVAPLWQAQYTIQAALPTAQEARLLGIAATDPCLVVVRRTVDRGVPVTLVRLVHPGARYQIEGHFSP